MPDASVAAILYLLQRVWYLGQCRTQSWECKLWDRLKLCRSTAQTAGQHWGLSLVYKWFKWQITIFNNYFKGSCPPSHSKYSQLNFQMGVVAKPANDSHKCSFRVKRNWQYDPNVIVMSDSSNNDWSPSHWCLYSYAWLPSQNHKHCPE